MIFNRDLIIHFMHVYNDLFVYVCYYKDKGLNCISDMDGELLEMIIEVIYTLI